MSNVSASLKYAEHDGWIRVEVDSMLTTGITDSAQKQLGDIVFLELPETGRAVAKDETIAAMESVKTVSSIFAPVADKIVANNADTAGMPESANAGAYGVWLFKIKPINIDDVNALISAADYEVKIG